MDENSNKEIVVILDSNEEDQTQDKDKKDEQNSKDTSSVRKDDAGCSADSCLYSLIFHSTNPPQSHRRARRISQQTRGKRLGTAWTRYQPITGHNHGPTHSPIHTLQEIGKCGRGNQSHKDSDKDEQHTDADMPGEGKDKTRNRTDTADGDKDEQQHADADMPSEGNEPGHRTDTADGDEDKEHVDADMPSEGKDMIKFTNETDGLNEMDMGCSTEKTDNHKHRLAKR
ncbi:hypothetical protein PDJAM_G00260560 [Pangasius djambal]|nr:hypothetical protein [Pangasius djambal]